jgi:hypothetical protein
MEGPDSQILALPVLSPDLNTVRRTAAFRLAADGTLTGDVVEKRFGDLAEQRRQTFTSGDAREQQEYLDHTLERDFTSFKLSAVKIENQQALNKELTLSYTLDAQRYGKLTGSLLIVRPRVLRSDFLDVDQRRRTIPINLYQTMQEHDEYDVELPTGYTVDELPGPLKLDLGFAAYESVSEVKDGKLHYTRTYTVREVTLPPEKYPDLQKLAAVIGIDEHRSVVLKKTLP